jgi:tRNA (guanine-N7-)-methyltransferase
MSSPGLTVDPLHWEPPFDWAALFGREGPVEVELGCGKGMFLKESARLFPEVNYLGVERAGRYFRTAVARLTRSGAAHVRLIRADGLDVLARWVPPASLRRLHIYFPDPWPKKRHHKRRLFRPALLELTLRALAPGGELRLATDHAAYAAVIRELLAGEPRFTPLPWEPEDPGRLPTNYALKWQRQGRRLWWARYAC